MIANTPEPPYYAVIFTSIPAEQDKEYAEMAEQMVTLAQQQEGFLGVESADDDIGITVSYWRDLDAIQQWKDHVDHQVTQERGKSHWYAAYKTRIAKVERDYGFEG